MIAGCCSSGLDRKRLDYGRQEIEPQISARTWDETNLANQITGWLVTNQVDITGQWVKREHDDGILLTIEKRKDGRYTVVFDADGDLARWTLMRTGTFAGGVFTLDRPVQGYVPFEPFRHFYLVQTPIGVRLISQPNVRFQLIEQKIMQLSARNWKLMKDLDIESSIFMKQLQPNQAMEDMAR